MARKAKTAEIWTVRTVDGDYVGTYRHYTAAGAIARAMHDQAVYLSTFRRSGSALLHSSQLVATIERLS